MLKDTLQGIKTGFAFDAASRDPAMIVVAKAVE